MTLPPVITSRTNAKVKALRAAFDCKASKPGELVAIEGATLIDEALRSGIRPEIVFVRQGSESVLESLDVGGVPVVELSRDVFASAVDTISPQGVAALIAIPEVRLLDMRANPGTFLFLEDIQDPGNLGTLIRSAEAFGVRCVYVTPGTVNTWNPKVMRASAGSVFRIPVYPMPLEKFLELMNQQGTRTVAAVARRDGAVSLNEADLHAPCAVMIGNEGAGLSERATSAASERVHIPCAVESLNAAIAGSVMMYEAQRQNEQMFERGAV